METANPSAAMITPSDVWPVKSASSDRRVSAPDDSSQSLPVESAVEPNAQPATVADVGGSEEDLRFRFDQRLLR